MIKFKNDFTFKSSTITITDTLNFGLVWFKYMNNVKYNNIKAKDTLLFTINVGCVTKTYEAQPRNMIKYAQNMNLICWYLHYYCSYGGHS